MQKTIIRFIDSIDSYDFSFKVDAEAFYKYLENDMDELERQYERYNL